MTRTCRRRNSATNDQQDLGSTRGAFDLPPRLDPTSDDSFERIIGARLLEAVHDDKENTSEHKLATGIPRVSPFRELALHSQSARIHTRKLASRSIFITRVGSKPSPSLSNSVRYHPVLRLPLVRGQQCRSVSVCVVVLFN